MYGWQTRMREANRNSKTQNFITKIEIVQKRSVMYYQVQKARSFLKIVVALPTMVAGCRGMKARTFILWTINNSLVLDCSEANILIRSWSISAFLNFIYSTFTLQVDDLKRLLFKCSFKPSPVFIALSGRCLFALGILEKGINIDGIGQRCFLTYESNVLFALRFMIDCDIVGGNWIELPAGNYCKSTRRLSYCQLELDIQYPISCQGSWFEGILFCSTDIFKLW